MKTKEGGKNLGVLQFPAAELYRREQTEIEELETLGMASALPFNCCMIPGRALTSPGLP